MEKINTLENVNFDVAISLYMKSKNRVIQYNRDHPEKVKVWQKSYYEKIKADPEKYQAMLNKKREKYELKKKLNKIV